MEQTKQGRLTDICFSGWGENIGKVFERKGGRRSSRVVKGASLVSENKRKPTDPRFAPPPQPGQSLKEKFLKEEQKVFIA